MIAPLPPPVRKAKYYYHISNCLSVNLSTFRKEASPSFLQTLWTPPLLKLWTITQLKLQFARPTNERPSNVAQSITHLISCYYIYLVQYLVNGNCCRYGYRLISLYLPRKSHHFSLWTKLKKKITTSQTHKSANLLTILLFVIGCCVEMSLGYTNLTVESFSFHLLFSIYRFPFY